MKNQRVILTLGALLIFATSLITGCGGTDKKSSPAPAAPASSQPAKPVGGAEETLAAIMMKAKQAPGYSCDIVMTAPGFSSTTKMWVA